MNRILMATCAVLSILGCNGSPEGPTLVTDAGVPMGDAATPTEADSGAIATTDAATTAPVDSGATPWRTCTGPCTPVIQFAILARAGLPGCADGWSPRTWDAAGALITPTDGPASPYMRVTVPAEWTGREVNVGFLCPTDGSWAHPAPGYTAEDFDIVVELWIEGDSTAPSDFFPGGAEGRFVSDRVTIALSYDEHGNPQTHLRLPMWAEAYGF
jgi:hypothetical protein